MASSGGRSGSGHRRPEVPVGRGREPERELVLLPQLFFRPSSGPRRGETNARGGADRLACEASVCEEGCVAYLPGASLKQRKASGYLKLALPGAASRSPPRRGEAMHWDGLDTGRAGSSRLERGGPRGVAGQ